MRRLLALAVLYATTASCQFANQAAVSDFDLVPACHPERADSAIALADCPGRPVRYYLKSDLVGDSATRVNYNRLLNGLLFGTEGSDGKFLPLTEQQVNNTLPSKSDRQGFLGVLYQVKDSKVWADGNTFAVYDILVSPFFRSEGLPLANRGVREAALSCKMEGISEDTLVELVVGAKPEMLETFRALAKCPATGEGSVRPLLLSSIGLARLGANEEAQEALDALNRFAAGNSILQSTIARVRAGLGSIPKDEAGVRRILTQWVGIVDEG